MKLALLLVVAAGCSNKDGAGSNAEPKAVEPPPKAVEPPKPADPKPAAVKVDPEIQKRVDAIIANCTVDVEGASVYDCKGEEKDAVLGYAHEHKVAGVFESLGEIAVASKDPKVLTAIAVTWPGFRDRALIRKAATPAAAERVLAMIPKVSPKTSYFGNAAAIPLIAGKRDELTKALTKLSPDSKIKQDAISEYLDWGGIAALPDVQAFYKAATTEGEQRAATSAVSGALPSKLSMSMNIEKTVSDADKKTMCEWVKSVAMDPVAPAGGYAGAVGALTRCGGTYIDAALAATEARVKAEKLTEPALDAIHHSCWGEAMVGGSINGSKEQCAKALAILESGIAAPELKPATVRSAIWTAEMLGKNEPGLAPKVKALAATFTSSKDKQVSDQAKETIKNLK